MGWLDRILGRDETSSRPNRPARSDDDIAIERYRYLLRTAPPETIEAVHQEAFSKLTPVQRDLLFEQLQADAAASERPTTNDPASLAQAATRSELRNPGSMERTLGAAGQRGGSLGFGGTFASSLMGSVTGFVIGSAIASAFLPDASGSADAAGADGDYSGDTNAAGGSGDSGGSDFGGGGYDEGGFGGGDFGDFGF